ncbi:MAG: hypothetical protein LBF01_00660 [Bacteroidales bacterium]|jgi:uncharacterized membrane protein|nr:hypothetical protein [Bacteroidales bacterium]
MENNQEPKKRTAPIIWGAVLITVGLIWILCAAHIIHLSFVGLFKYVVPFSMIVCGIILLVKNRLYKIICLAVSIVLFILLLIFNGSCRERRDCGNREFFSGRRGVISDRLDRHERQRHGKHHHFDTRAKFDVELENGVVKVEVAAGVAELKAGKTTENYLDIYKDGKLKESFTAAGEKEIRVNKRKGVELEMAFNATSLYDMEFELGVVNSELNLAPYKVQNLKVETGVSDVNLTLGDKVEHIAVKIETGVGSVTIRVPKGSGCSVENGGFLVDKDLPDFKKVDGVYKTDNFDNVKNKIAIVFEGALSELKIERY